MNRITAVVLALLLALVPAGALGRGHGGGHSSSTHSTHSSSGHSSHRSTSGHSSTRSSGSHRSTTTRSYTKKSYSTGTHRTSHGKYKRDPEQRRAFMKAHPCPSTGKTSGACPGYVVDHVTPLKRGGADRPENMQWQTTSAAKAKDKVE